MPMQRTPLHARVRRRMVEESQLGRVVDPLNVSSVSETFSAQTERKWVEEGRNEALDCLVYAICAHNFLGWYYRPMGRPDDPLWEFGGRGVGVSIAA